MRETETEAELLKETEAKQTSEKKLAELKQKLLSSHPGSGDSMDEITEYQVKTAELREFVEKRKLQFEMLKAKVEALAEAAISDSTPPAPPITKPAPIEPPVQPRSLLDPSSTSHLLPRSVPQKQRRASGDSQGSRGRRPSDTGIKPASSTPGSSLPSRASSVQALTPNQMDFRDLSRASGRSQR